MLISLKTDELHCFLNSQLTFHFPDINNPIKFNDKAIKSSFSESLERLEYCFSHIAVRGYHREEQVYFNHLHLDQYSQFLYFFSNSLWKNTQQDDLCSRIVLLNRCLSGCWFSYKGNFPNIFILVHPVGSVIGHLNVKFSDYLVVLQNVTINGVSDCSLNLGKGLFLAAGAQIIGGGSIGDRVSIGANTTVRLPNIDNDKIVYRDDSTGVITIKSNQKNTPMAQSYFYDDLSQ